MNLSKLSVFIALALVLAVGATGCKRKPGKGVTPIPGKSGSGSTTRSTPAPPIIPPGNDVRFTKPITEETPLADTGSGKQTAGLDLFEGMAMDREKFKSETVYFEFDRSNVKKSEVVKIESVALYLKGDTTKKLLIEGHCDERGTDEYNRALGERRALALREFLVNAGIGADRIRTLSYGKDRPAVVGHDDSAWSKNRRGEFILLIPKQ